jgi:hypothetical protein
MVKHIYINIICVFLVLFVILYVVHKKVNKYTHEKGININKVNIPDIIHDSIPRIYNLDIVSDNFTITIVIIFVVVFLLNGQYKYIIFLLLLIILGQFICSIFFISTILPDSSKVCKYSEDTFKALYNMGSCNNLGISGHFINILFILGLFYKYYGRKYWIFYILIYVTGFLLICASRNHYTIDCLTSTFVGLFIIYEFNNIQKGVNFIIGNKFFDL